MRAILTVSGPIYFIILLGYLCTRGGLFARQDMRVFGKFVVNLCLPALLFNSLAQRRFDEILNTSYLAAYALGSLGVVAMGWLWCRRVQGRAITPSAVMVMGMACSNSGFVGYPILLLTLAPVAGVVLALNMIVENLLVIPLMLALAERGRGNSGHWLRVVGQSLARLAKNPMIIGLVAGFAASLLHWTPPEPVARTVNLFAMASGAMSLFVIGGTLCGLSLKGLGRRVFPIVAGKLLLHPVMVLLVLFLLPTLGLAAPGVELSHAAVLMAAMPMMGIYPILAQTYGEEDASAAALLVATITSFFTLSSLLWVFQHTG